MRRFIIVGGLLGNATASLFETRGLEAEEANSDMKRGAAGGSSSLRARILIEIPIELHSVIQDMYADFAGVKSLFSEVNELNGVPTQDGTRNYGSLGGVLPRPLEYHPEKPAHKSLHHLFSQPMDRMEKISIISKFTPLSQLKLLEENELTLYKKYRYQLTSLTEIYASDYFARQLYFVENPLGRYRRLSEVECRERFRVLIDLRDKYERQLKTLAQRGVQFHRINQTAFSLGKATLLAISIPLIFTEMSYEQITLINKRTSAYVQELHPGAKDNIHSIYGILKQVVAELYTVNRFGYIQSASSLTNISSILALFADWTAAIDELKKLESRFIH